MVKKVYPVNLNDEIADKVKEIVPNFSKLVEDLLVEYLEANKERQQQSPIERKIKARIAEININVARMEQDKADIEVSLPLIHKEAEFLIKQLQESRDKTKKTQKITP